MNTPRVNWKPALASHLVELGAFRDTPFCLVDVGASGGIDGYWDVFGDSLRAFGFDSLVEEVERLNAAASGTGRRYYPYLVGDKSYEIPQGVPHTSAYPRSSSARAMEIANCNYAKTYFDQTGAGLCATETIELDGFFPRDHPADVDFIKVDTDGAEYQVLRGAKELLARGQVLGVAVECQFHGLVHNESSTFRNIDRLLTGLGFSLFDLDVHRYSRAALPQPFVYRLPAQTESGQVFWGDALYLRDAGGNDYETMWSMALPMHKVLKLACLFELFGLADCAAELLLKYRTAIGDALDVDACLDLLTPPVDGLPTSYREYTARFERNPESFYPQPEISQADVPAGAQPAPAAPDGLRHLPARLLRAVEDLGWFPGRKP